MEGKPSGHSELALVSSLPRVNSLWLVLEGLQACRALVLVSSLDDTKQNIVMLTGADSVLKTSSRCAAHSHRVSTWKNMFDPDRRNLGQPALSFCILTRGFNCQVIFSRSGAAQRLS